MNFKRSNITRRSAMRIAAFTGTLCTIPSIAMADTQTDLSSAQGRLAKAQTELDAIASEYEQLSTEQAKTLDQIEGIQGEIKKLVKHIHKLEGELKKKREELSVRVSDEYKDGSRGVVDLLLRSASVEDLISNLYYFDKINEEQANLIRDVNDKRDECAEQQLELEAQKASLEEVSQTQSEQLAAMRDKQQEARELIEGLDKEVKDLLAKRDAELLAAQKEAAKAQAEREAAEQKAAEQNAEDERQSSQSESSQKETDQKQDEQKEEDKKPEEQEQKDASQDEQTPQEEASANDDSNESDDVSLYDEGSSTGSAAAVVSACYSTPSPGAGLCAGWCSDVMINAGYGFVSGNANDMYAEFCFSSNRSELKPGMAIAVSTHPHTSAGRIYGHIGMYVGDNTMMDNIGYIRTISVDEWCSFYGATVPPRWGWLNNIVLS